MNHFEFQAEAYIDFHKRSGISFDTWARSKGFSLRDRTAIWQEVERLQASKMKTGLLFDENEGSD